MRAGLAQLADTFVSDPRRHFAEGQSVRAAVAAVDAARGRFALSLKPSLVAAPDGAYLGSLFRDLECAERMRYAPRAECKDFREHREVLCWAVAVDGVRCCIGAKWKDRQSVVETLEVRW